MTKNDGALLHKRLTEVSEKLEKRTNIARTCYRGLEISMLKRAKLSNVLGLDSDEKEVEAILKELEQKKCCDINCNGKMMVYTVEGIVVRDGCLYPEMVYYVCTKCTRRWVYDTFKEKMGEW
jgi:hypothetical protein